MAQAAELPSADQTCRAEFGNFLAALSSSSYLPLYVARKFKVVKVSNILFTKLKHRQRMKEKKGKFARH